VKHILFTIAPIIFGFEVWSQSGQLLFNNICFTCHNKIDAEKGLTGPELGGITNLVTEEWFIEYVNSPYLMRKKGDYRNWCAWEHWKPTWMPNFKDSLTDVQIRSIYDYIAEETAEKDLKYQYACDSNFAFSNFYFYDSLPQLLASQLGLSFEWKDDTILSHQKIIATVEGDFHSINFFEMHSSRQELERISFDDRKGFKGPFHLDYLDIYPGNYLIVVAQGNFNQFDIQKFSLAKPLPENLKIILGEKGDMIAEIKALKL